MFKTGVQKLNRLLCPVAEPKEGGVAAELREGKAALPDATIAKVVQMLKAAPRWVHILLYLASRAGSQMALTTVLSLYPHLDLSLLGVLHAGSADMLSPVYLEVNQRSAEIASWLNPQEYVPFLDDQGVAVPHMMMSELACSIEEDSSESSCPREGIQSSSGAYQEDDLEAESSRSSSRRSKPSGTDRTEPSMQQLGPTAPPAQPTASQLEPAATQPDQTAS